VVGLRLLREKCGSMKEAGGFAGGDCCRNQWVGECCDGPLKGKVTVERWGVRSGVRIGIS